MQSSGQIVEGYFDPIKPTQRLARLVGFLYLMQMAMGVFGQSFVRDQLIVRGDAAKTAHNITEAERLFRFSIAGDLLTYATVIVLIWGLYLLLRAVHRDLALLALILRLAENAVLCAATANSLVTLRLLSSNSSLAALNEGQRFALGILTINTQGAGMSIAFILLGFGSAIFSYLWWKSGYIPRWLAGLGVIGSLLLPLITLAAIVFPSLSPYSLAFMIPLGLFEVGLGLWLLIKGVKLPLHLQSSAPAETFVN